MKGMDSEIVWKDGMILSVLHRQWEISMNVDFQHHISIPISWVDYSASEMIGLHIEAETLHYIVSTLII